MEHLLSQTFFLIPIHMWTCFEYDKQCGQNHRTAEAKKERDALFSVRPAIHDFFGFFIVYVL
jgi:hypothetical protein